MKVLLQEEFNLLDVVLTPLEGYIISNYKVECKQGTYVLKKYPFTPETLAQLEGENFVLDMLNAKNDGDYPLIIPSVKGASITIVSGYIYRLLTFIEGKFLGDVDHPPALLYSLGQFLGKLDKVTCDLQQTAITAIELQWDLKHFKQNYQYIQYIPDPKDRSLVDYFYLQFDERVYPHQYKIRKGVIHNDANDWNVLTQNGQVSGIIDFGDMCHSWIINELAVAITYVMMGKENPLDVAAHVIRGYHDIFPLLEMEIDLLYYLVAARLCTSVCNSAYAKTLKPDAAYITISEKPAWELLRKWLTINPINAKDVFRRFAGFQLAQKIPMPVQLKRRKAHLGGALSLSYNTPIQMYQSAFQYMYDTDGNTFLDAYNNIMLAGHSHPKVVRAGQRAMAKLNTNTRYIYSELLDYSDKLLSKFPKHLNKVFFVNSGSAATDLAIRIAMTHTRKEKVMVLEHGYHGNTRLGIDISHYKYSHPGGSGRKSHIIATPMPNAFGSGFMDDGSAGAHFSTLTEDQINANSSTIGAFIAEPIVGCGGQVPLANGYLKAVYPKIRAQGGLCISDEVQVGFGRLGDFFWGFEMHGVVPDLVILGKPMGNGHPIGAVVTTTEIAASFDNGLEFFSSFGGNPVSCAIGQAVLEVIEAEHLQKHAKETGDYFKLLLKKLQQKYPQIADIRGYGLFLGIELVDRQGDPGTALASQLKNGLREKYILVGTDGPFDSVLKIKPPLSFNKKDCSLVIDAMETILLEIVKN